MAETIRLAWSKEAEGAKARAVARKEISGGTVRSGKDTARTVRSGRGIKRTTVRTGRPDLWAKAVVAAAKSPEAPKPAKKREMPAAEPTLGSRPEPAPAAAPEQSRLDMGETANRHAAPQSEEDLLEIPAFLRRQAN